MCEYNQFGQALGVALPDWQPRPWPTRQVLQGSRCRLEPLTLAHASDLFAAHQLAPDARSWTWLLREPESNLAEFSAWVEQVATLADPIHFAVVDQQRGKAVGSLAKELLHESGSVDQPGEAGTDQDYGQFLVDRLAFERLRVRVVEQ